MKIWQLITLSLSPAAIAASLNFGHIVIANIEIGNNYKSKINYAVNSDVDTAIAQFTEVKEWMKANNLSSGNTCIWAWEKSPRCELDSIYTGRIKLTLKELNQLKTINDPLTTSNGFLKIRERHLEHDKGSVSVQEPINFNLAYRWHTRKNIGAAIDIFMWTIFVVLVFGLVFGISLWANTFSY
jgi:hypothetical protein